MQRASASKTTMEMDKIVNRAEHVRHPTTRHDAQAAVKTTLLNAFAVTDIM